MDWELDKKRPLCPQICEQLCIMIARDDLKPGDRLMSVREVALLAQVTPNTVQKSYEQLEAEGVIYSRRGAGWYVSDNQEIAQEVRRQYIRSKTEEYIRNMQILGLSGDEIEKYVKEFINE